MKHNMVKNPNWHAGGSLPAGYIQSVTEDLNSGRPRTNPVSGRVEGLNPGPPDYKTSALNHSATLSPFAEHLSHGSLQQVCPEHKSSSKLF